MANATILTIIALYMLVLIGIGYYSYRATTKIPEDYFLASRGLGPLVLFFAVFATNITAFTFLGVTGQAYRQGIGLYGLVAFGTAFITPATFYIIGYRSWLVGKKYGYMTQAEMLGERWESRAVALVMFVLLILYTVPYMVTSFIGAGTALASITNNTIPYFWGTLATVLVTTLYTSSGGMRGTAWTNVFQGMVFLVVGVVIFLLIGRALGGFESITGKVLTQNPKLLVKAGNFSPQQWFSYLFISPLAVVVFPHVFVRLLSSKSAAYLKKMVTIYPILVLITFVPVVYIGVWGTAAIPGLQGKAADSIFPMMLAKYLPPAFMGLGLAGILAAIMSSVDAMLLTISHMLVRDVIQPLRPHLEFSRLVWLGRLFVWAVAVVAFILALLRPGTIFAIATYAFTGYACLAPVIIGGLYWRRSNKYGALAAMIVGAVLLPLYQFTPYLKWSTFGFYPAIPLLVITTIVFVVVSYLTPPASEAATRRFFDLFDALYAQNPELKTDSRRAGEVRA